jgi:hypothetical protein
MQTFSASAALIALPMVMYDPSIQSYIFGTAQLMAAGVGVGVGVARGLGFAMARRMTTTSCETAGEAARIAMIGNAILVKVFNGIVPM